MSYSLNDRLEIRLLGKTLWNDIDQVAGFESSELDAVKQLGFLIGNAGANPCPALERMLRDSADPLDDADAKNCLRLKKQTFCLRSSESSSIETNAEQHCTLDFPLFTGPREKKYDNFKSILRLTAVRLQDGWAKLEFAPEIHHGMDRVRPMVVNGGWQAKESQEVDTLPQRFSLKLHVGEMAVMTAASADPRSFGHHAFIREDAEKGPVQRLLVVRLSNMSRIDPVYSTPESRTAALVQRLEVNSGRALDEDRVESPSQGVPTIGGPPLRKLAFEIVERVLLLGHPVF